MRVADLIVLQQGQHFREEVVIFGSEIRQILCTLSANSAQKYSSNSELHPSFAVTGPDTFNSINLRP